MLYTLSDTHAVALLHFVISGNTNPRRDFLVFNKSVFIFIIIIDVFLLDKLMLLAMIVEQLIFKPLY